MAFPTCALVWPDWIGVSWELALCGFYRLWCRLPTGAAGKSYDGASGIGLTFGHLGSRPANGRSFFLWVFLSPCNSASQKMSNLITIEKKKEKEEIVLPSACLLLGWQGPGHWMRHLLGYTVQVCGKLELLVWCWNCQQTQIPQPVVEMPQSARCLSRFEFASYFVNNLMACFLMMLCCVIPSSMVVHIP